MNSATNSSRPFTSTFRPGVLTLVRFYSAQTCVECLVHAWDALDAVARGEKVAENIDYAVRKFRQAQMTLGDVKRNQKKAAVAELASLYAAIRNHIDILEHDGASPLA